MPQASANGWSKGSVVLDKCFTTFSSASIEGHTNNGWAGDIEYSSDGGTTWGATHCTDCTDQINDNTKVRIVADGNDSGASMAETDCLGGATCTLTAPSALTPL